MIIGAIIGQVWRYLAPLHSRAFGAIALLIAGLVYPCVTNAQFVPVAHNLRIWLDTADINAGAAQPANGAALSPWKDKSGNGYGIIASGSPTYESTGLNSLPSVRMPFGAKFSAGKIFQARTVRKPPYSWSMPTLP